MGAATSASRAAAIAIPMSLFAAIGLPMMPRPMNPIRDIRGYLQPKLVELSAGSDGLYSQPIQPV